MRVGRRTVVAIPVHSCRSIGWRCCGAVCAGRQAASRACHGVVVHVRCSIGVDVCFMRAMESLVLQFMLVCNWL
jgi:hypothetical protein